MEEELLINPNDYLKAGIHIATKVKSAGMAKFIMKVREDGLYLLDIKSIDSRIRVAGAMISRYEARDVVVTASRLYAITAAKRFAEVIDAKFIPGRVTPGIFTNPYKEGFSEIKLLVISDSRNEKQGIKEASTVNVPIIALNDTDNITKYLDLIIPVNNRGRRALAYTYYLLAREVLKNRGTIKSYDEFKYTPEDFEIKIEGKEAKREHSYEAAPESPEPKEQLEVAAKEGSEAKIENA
jgi:SSU ribosomal protein S2P